MEDPMRRHGYRYAASCLLGYALLTGPAGAAAPTPLNVDGFYGGLKVAYFDPEMDKLDEQNFDGPDNAGFVLGYERRYEAGYGGAELTYSTSFLDGSIDSGPVSANTFGVFAVYRTIESRRVHTGPYLKLKAGAYHYDAEIGDQSESASTAAFGIGFGINMYVVRFELELLVPEKDLQYVSFHILF
ncbi:hypothetical protein Q4485_15355 [Granulosicoccaceae sp. 1_MG-2023]|nr:hypothetical protein [Granulosicoccaceae sp. 1_MG-2023]